MRKRTAEKFLQLFRALWNAAISKENAKMQFFRGPFSQMRKLTWDQHWTHAK